MPLYGAWLAYATFGSLLVVLLLLLPLVPVLCALGGVRASVTWCMRRVERSRGRRHAA